MEIKKQLERLSLKIKEFKEKINTETATRMAFVDPLIGYLGYDTSNPLEVQPEFIADIGTKKGEKVDYAILNEKGDPIILIEAKHWKENLNGYNSQLNRYFGVTSVRIGILTNGIKYEFYSDIDNKNTMDRDPFLILDLNDIKEDIPTELLKFHKDNFDVNSITSRASNLKKYTAIKDMFLTELNAPSEELAKVFFKKIYSDKVFTGKAKIEFPSIIKKALSQTITDIVNERLTNALLPEIEEEKEEIKEIKNKIITTEEELEGFHIIKALIRDKLHLGRINFRDNQSYFAILIDDNNRKPLCRLHFNTANKYITLFNENEIDGIKISLTSIDNLYDYKEQLHATIEKYITETIN